MDHRRSKSWIVGVALGVLVLPARSAPAQAPKPLGVARTTYPAEFSRISGFRELADGTLLIADQKENRLVRLDPRTGGTTDIGRPGQGPGEYASVAGGLFAARGDSTILFDTRANQWRYVVGTRIVANSMARGGSLIGGDTVGTALLMQYLPYHGPPIATIPGDHTYVVVDSVRFVVQGGPDSRTDTIAAAVGGSSTRHFGSDGSQWAVQTPLTSATQAVLFPDGWVAIAYTDPYRVAWRRPHGSLANGPALPFEGIAVGEPQKRAYLDDLARLMGLAIPPAVFDAPWADMLPPFLADALLAAPDGRLVIQRTLESPTGIRRYDVIDRRGMLSLSFTLPLNERLVGFGKGAAFSSVVDNDGILRIRRYAWPPGA